MTVTPQDKERHFELYADDVAGILRGIGARWGGTEQIDNDDTSDEVAKRYALGYEYPNGEERGYVRAMFWYGQTGALNEAREGKALQLVLPAGAYACAKVDVVFNPAQMIDEFSVDGKHDVFSLGELKDRINVMWNSDVWGLTEEDTHLEHNAAVYREFAQIEQLFKAAMKPAAATLKKMGAAWGGEEQSDNAPDPDDQKGGIGGLFGGGGKKRFFVGYSVPSFGKDKAGKAHMTRGAVWLDLWQGKKGTIQKSNTARQVQIAEKPAAHISVVFLPGRMAIEGVKGAEARNEGELKALLTKIWRDDVFGVR